MASQTAPTEIPDVDAPIQLEEPALSFLPQVDSFLWVSQTRRAFGVSGAGLTAAVLDTGLNAGHVDFAGRVPTQRNFTTDNGGDPTNAADGNGHGTNVAGIIAADGDHKGIAPGAQIIPLKVLGNTGGGSFAFVESALQWVLDNQQTFNISVACLSLSDGGNHLSDDFGANAVRDRIVALRAARVPVVVAAGNHYFQHGSQQGMGYPAILRECISVGAVYDAAEGGFAYRSGAQAFSSRAGQITPFSQRLHYTVNRNTRTDIFAPGAPVTSSGILGEHGESVQHGTSQATPVTAGVILLMQEFYKLATGQLPEVDDLVTWLRRGGVTIVDGDDEDDNVQHTGLSFLRVDALSALDAVRRHLQRAQLAGESAPA